MHPFDRTWLARPILTALGAGTLLGMGACGGAVAPGSEYDPAWDVEGDSGGAAGRTGSAANGGQGGTGRAAGGSSGISQGGAAFGGAGGSRPGNGGVGGIGAAGSASAGAAGTGFGGAAGSAGSFAGAAGAAGAAGSMGFAGSTSMPEESYCVNLDFGLGSLPSSALNLDPDLARNYCRDDYVPGMNYQMLCVPAPPNGQSCDGFYPRALLSVLYECGLQSSATFVCDPGTPLPGMDGCYGNECCYVLGGGCPVGRPFLVNERARTAVSVPRADWLLEQLPSLAELDALTRRALADVYRRDGLSEHASVASFARFVLECLALGAPADLLAEAQAALQDEIAHAQLSFGLASAYAGSPLGPSGLDVSDCLPSAPSVAGSLQRVIREGCIAETVSAALIRHASQAAEDPAVKAVLARVAEDERRHALLAWRFARWLIGSDQSLRELAAREFSEAPRHVGFGAIAELPGDARALRAHGVLAVAERRSVARQTLEQVVAPCARELLAARSVRLTAAPEAAAPAAAAQAYSS